ncbi:MFS transporter [Caldimonas brevitalea]|uniref:Major facilitator superfamily n=1 Tax=Caldimonas brevitalea TaxID=413882 RepID=A0A0G3BPW3_9BURK|nr:MFS transporter [Caldimonas brevitalea]AKJ29386.1 major facilitator superfamily [Caldimonas brevitalea]
MSAVAPLTPTLDDQRYLLGFMALGVLAGTSNGVAKVVLPLYAASLHAASWQIGLVGGLQFAGMLLLSMPIGALIDRHGSRALFRFGGLGAALLFLLGFSQSREPWQLIAGVLLFGLINPFRMVATQTEFLQLLPRLKPRQAGWNRGSHTAGMFFIGPVLGAALVGWVGFQHTFFVVAAGLLLTVLIGNRVLGAAPPGRGAEALGVWQRVRGQFGLIAQRADLRRTMRIECCGQIAMSYFTVFIVLLAMREFHLPLPLAAGLVTLQGALFVLTLFLAGGWLARWQQEQRYLLAFTLLLAAEALLSLPLHAACLWLAAALLGVGLGVQHLTSVTRFAALAQELGRGPVGGLFTLAGPAGGLFGAVAGGLLGQHFGLWSGFRGLAVVYLLAVGWQLVRLRRGGLGEPSSA